MLARVRKAMEEREGGFTLIELLVVIIIIGILAAIAIPVFLNQRKKGWDAQAKSDLRNAATAQETYLTDQGNYTLTVANLSTNGFKKSADVTSFTVANGYAADVTTKTSTDVASVGGYCMEATSKSGNVFTYDSTKGGVGRGSTTSAC
jgi:type IV pilus assembly protein PilA